MSPDVACLDKLTVAMRQKFSKTIIFEVDSLPMEVNSNNNTGMTGLVLCVFFLDDRSMPAKLFNGTNILINPFCDTTMVRAGASSGCGAVRAISTNSPLSSI